MYKPTFVIDWKQLPTMLAQYILWLLGNVIQPVKGGEWDA